MRITPLIASRFRTDGGAIFGFVPKTIWQRMLAADERNTIPQNINSLLIRLDDGRLGLVEAGCGNPAWYPERERGYYALAGEWPLAAALTRLGVPRESIDFVILTHLHWDHAGGVGHVHPDGSLELSFPNAVHYVHAMEWRVANSGDRALYKSYPSDTIDPFRRMAAQRLRLIHEDQAEIVPGVRMLRSGGHTEGHATISVTAATIEIDHPSAPRETPRLLYAGDVCPMQHSLRLVFQTAYDTFPLDTRRWKLRVLPQLVESGTWLLFVHDPELSGATIRPDERMEYVVVDRLTCPA